MNATEIRSRFADAIAEIERGGDVRALDRSLREAGLSRSRAKIFVSVAKRVAKIFDEFGRHA